MEKHSVTTNILHLINGEHYSGAERVQDLLAKRLSHVGYKVYIACLKPKYFIDNCSYDPKKIFSFPMSTRLDFKCIIKLLRFITIKNIKLIHTHTPRTLLIGTILSKFIKLPIVHHLHSPTDNDTTNKIRNSINNMVETICLRQTHRIIPVSNSLKCYLIRKHISSKKIITVLNGVQAFPNLPPFKARAEVFVIGVVALFRPRKGLEVLMKAVALLIKNKNYRILINAVGPFESEEYETEIMKLADTLGIKNTINWLGFKQDIKSQFQKMDLFILPSLFGEGTPMVILEAMAFGVPIIGTRVEGIPETISNGNEGLLIEPGNIQQMAKGIEKFYNNKFDIFLMRKKAHRKQLDHYSDVSMANKVSNIYSQILINKNEIGQNCKHSHR